MCSRWLTDLVCYASLSYLVCDTAKTEKAAVEKAVAEEKGKC